MSLTAEQKQFFDDNGYLPYGRVLSDEEVQALRQRSEDIAAGRLTHVPSRYIQFEAAFRDGKETTDPRIDMIRKMVYLCYHDDLFEAAAKNPAIVDVIAVLLGPDIKFYADQLMMKPRFYGTVTDWLAYRAIDMRGQESPEEGAVENVKAFADFCRHSGGFEIH